MEHLQIILPSVLLLIGFLLKLLVGRNYDMPATIQAICELPVDIIFLALSFTVAFTITKVDNQSSGLFYCFIGIATAILIVLLWRISVDQFLKKSRILFYRKTLKKEKKRNYFKGFYHYFN